MSRAAHIEVREVNHSDDGAVQIVRTANHSIRSHYLRWRNMFSHRCRQEQSGGLVERVPCSDADDGCAPTPVLRKLLRRQNGRAGGPARNGFDGRLGLGVCGGTHFMVLKAGQILHGFGNRVPYSFLKVLGQLAPLLVGLREAQRRECDIVQVNYQRTFLQKLRSLFRDLRGIGGQSPLVKELRRGQSRAIPEHNVKELKLIDMPPENHHAHG